MTAILDNFKEYLFFPFKTERCCAVHFNKNSVRGIVSRTPISSSPLCNNSIVRSNGRKEAPLPPKERHFFSSSSSSSP
jgi:hypothetical protein